MTNKFYCPTIHGALVINIKKGDVRVQSCCLRNDPTVYTSGDMWQNIGLTSLRDYNNNNEQFHPGCWNCEALENARYDSYRTGMLEKYGRDKEYSGPVRLDVMFDISCNLACRICGPELSTYWQKHLKENNFPIPVTAPQHNADPDEMIKHISSLDLSNLQEVVFCGGETMLGNAHWKVAEALAQLIPDAKKRVMLQFQTNGTIPLNTKHYEILEKFKLVKFLISMDGTKDQFEYMRWPADWNQFTDNLMAMKAKAPVNVMFLIEETVSIFNLFYLDRSDSWIENNFAKNRLGDIVNSTKHVAMGTFDINNITNEYYKKIKDSKYVSFVNADTWKENPAKIKLMIAEIKKFDQARNQNWQVTFPEVADFYSRYI
jgi:sulfatase maturation enzyme AslB (radical SAM superfamily)